MNSSSVPVPAVVRRAAVLGAGVMGRAIAAHLAQCGLDVLLLDLPARDSAPGDPPARRDALAAGALAALPKDRPSPLVHPSVLARIEAGNFEDDMHRLAQVDWVIEAVLERVDVKERLLARVAAAIGPHTVLSSNTSGIPIATLADFVPEATRARFLGTHFFNPPRYMHLLEIIPGPHTDPAVVTLLTRLGEDVLGKGVVVAKDRPNFVANRIGTYGVLRSVQLMLERGLNPTEVDFLTGPLMGRPKSAVFRTVDLVGLDTLLHVAENVVHGAPDDPQRAVFEPIPVLQQMVERELVGEKKGAGFYRKVKSADGASAIEALDLDTFAYGAKPKARFAEIDAVRPIEDLRERLRALFHAKGRGADFTWAITRDTLLYAAQVATEIADDLASIDRAMRWGFGWDLGPFESWETLGVAKVAERMQRDGLVLPDWVMAHLERGAKSFYVHTADGEQVLDLTGTSTRAVPERPGVLALREVPRGPRKVKGNQGATLWDLGDGVFGLEFHSKMNALGPDIVQMVQNATEHAERHGEGLVVGNDGVHFSAGANLALLLIAALEGEYDEIDLMVRHFQRMTTGLRHCARPVVIAPFSLTLGGGCEVLLHGDRVVAAAELYCGLVEGGVGLIPAGGGTKELYVRKLDAHGGDARRAARAAFEVIGLAKVSTSAHEARDLGFLRDRDGIVFNRDHLLAVAKQEVLAMARSGYAPPAARKEIPVGGADTLALVEAGLHNFHAAGHISDHDRLIGRKLGHILSGGAHKSGPSPRTVSEQQLLDLEREAFLSLCGERKTLERIQHMLQKGKPLRN
jgi:3-hydroxyacyl-CoA dehydrogenase